MATIVGALPTDIPVPRLLWTYDEGDDGWIVLLFEYVPGHHPAEPWLGEELSRVLTAMSSLAITLTPTHRWCDRGHSRTACPRERPRVDVAARGSAGPSRRMVAQASRPSCHAGRDRVPGCRGPDAFASRYPCRQHSAYSQPGLVCGLAARMRGSELVRRCALRARRPYARRPSAKRACRELPTHPWSRPECHNRGRRCDGGLLHPPRDPAVAPGPPHRAEIPGGSGRYFTPVVVRPPRLEMNTR